MLRCCTCPQIDYQLCGLVITMALFTLRSDLHSFLSLQKSLEKLSVPDWYLNSDMCPGDGPHKYPHEPRCLYPTGGG